MTDAKDRREEAARIEAARALGVPYAGLDAERRFDRAAREGANDPN